jgi:hypothetical protein
LKALFLLLLCLPPLYGHSQINIDHPETVRKNDFYVYWGWNREWFTKSDIHFTGSNYDFKLTDVVATDKPAEFEISTYFSPQYVTIPQYNFRVGYFISDHWDLSIGIDHMKYVVTHDQTVKIDGEIDVPNTSYNGSYNNEDIVLTRGFLELEHTDGLNWGGIDLRRFDHLLEFKNTKLGLTEGLGAAMIFPKTDAHLLNYQRHDKYHISGYGLNAAVGLQLSFKSFFIQSEIKGGYINMPNIRTTQHIADNASQSFFFSQFNVVIGANFKKSPLQSL